MGFSYSEMRAYRTTNDALKAEVQQMAEQAYDMEEVSFIRAIDDLLALPAERQTEIISKHYGIIRALFDRAAQVQGVL